jgi:hypothetical protein
MRTTARTVGVVVTPLVETLRSFVAFRRGGDVNGRKLQHQSNAENLGTIQSHSHFPVRVRPVAALAVEWTGSGSSRGVAQRQWQYE